MYEKIKVLDHEYESEHSEEIKIKLIDEIRKICKSIQEEAEKAESLENLDSCQKKLKDLNNDISKSIKTKSEFNEIFDLLKEINENIENFGSTFLHNSRYNNDYLDRLRSKDPKNFSKILAELKT